MVIITKKITTIGGSKGVILDKVLLEKLNYSAGDHVEIKIKKVVFENE